MFDPYPGHACGCGTTTTGVAELLRNVSPSHGHAWRLWVETCVRRKCMHADSTFSSRPTSNAHIYKPQPALLVHGKTKHMCWDELYKQCYSGNYSQALNIIFIVDGGRFSILFVWAAGFVEVSTARRTTEFALISLENITQRCSCFFSDNFENGISCLYIRAVLKKTGGLSSVGPLGLRERVNEPIIEVV
jgi:hypothetical protein